MNIIQEYREASGVSQSELKRVLSNSTDIKKTTTKMNLGSLIDAILFTPYKVKDWFFILRNDTKLPPPQIKETIDTYYQSFTEVFKPEWIDTELLDTFRKISDSKSKDDVVLKSLNKWGCYWDMLIDSNGKTIITQTYYDKCIAVVNTLLSNVSTSKYFNPTLSIKNKFQFDNYWKYTNIVHGWTEQCKGLLDILRIDDSAKTVQVIDLKTTSENLDFNWKYVARKFRYDIQLAYYYYGIEQYIKQYYPDYKQLLPVIIVENIDYPGKPRVIQFTHSDLYIGTYGAKRKKSQIYFETIEDNINTFEYDTIQGWQDAIKIYHDCKELGLNDWDIDYHNTKGVSDFNLWL